MIQVFAFYLFASITVLSGALTVTSRNPVHSVLWLILAFFNAAGLMLIVGAEFIAMLLVIVYVGAVAVLFLFVVMMLDIDFTELRTGITRYIVPAVLLLIVVAGELIVATQSWSLGTLSLAGSAPTPEPLAVPNIQALGILIYTRYLYIFEGAGLVLLVALIGAIVLTHRPRHNVRTQNVARQNQRRPQDATRNTQPAVGQGVEL